MHKFRTLAISALAMIALVAFAVGGASACDGKTSASTASADAKVAGAGCTASATTAGTKVAGAGCTHSIDASTAGAGCSVSASAAKVAMETVRMPSGALAVFYKGTDAETVAYLQTSAATKGANFGCGLAGAMAGNENCTVEVANTKSGIMLLVSSEKSELIDEFQESYAVAMTQHAQTETGGE